ncbi:MAG: M23 family metallopeptidase [bacterium]|nr:M23 family metallopeptidase [bacterium]
MKRDILFSIILLFIFQNSIAQNDKNVSEKWNELDKKIVNATIDKEDAVELMKEYNAQLRKYYRTSVIVSSKREDWVFPLKNFTSIRYRDYGNDYKVLGYDYFQGSNTKGHPAHDIMILDSNKDLMDDSTKSPVDVVSMSGGIVVATDTTWSVGSLLRGGKYVKIFDVSNDGIFYYSHLSEVNVRAGDIVLPGDKIGEVGRTGRKAILAPGKTHLHVAYLRFENDYPFPEDIIADLRNSQKKLPTVK